MLTVAYCREGPGAAAARERVGEARRAHLERHRGQIALAALLAPEDGAREDQPRGAVLVIDAPDRASARAILAEDPHVTGGVWTRVDLYDVASFHGVWSPGYEQAFQAALEAYPVDEVLSPPATPRTYAMFAAFRRPFEPTPEQVLGHKRLGARMSRRLMAAMPMVYAESLGAAPETRWSLLCVLHAEDRAAASRMYLDDPLAIDGLMEATLLEMPAPEGRWIG